jgi:hypothetical protein
MPKIAGMPHDHTAPWPHVESVLCRENAPAALTSLAIQPRAGVGTQRSLVFGQRHECVVPNAIAIGGSP